MPKAVRKDFFTWNSMELQRILSKLFENMRFTDIQLHGATRDGNAAACDRIEMGQHVIDLRLQLSVKWTEQSDGVTAIFTIEESQYDWSACLCNRLADSVIGALKTIWELEHGSDA